MTNETKKTKTLAELRAAAYAAFAAHEADMKSDPEYRKAAEEIREKQDRAARKAGHREV